MGHLPRIACFHGSGSSAAIFAFQCATLQNQLADTFEFVFFEGPYERDAGPGVLPFFTFEEFGPYRMWFYETENGDQVLDGRTDAGRGEAGIERVLRLIKEKGTGGEWVGCMGFSQGTRIVGGLLLHQQNRKEMGFIQKEGDIEFKFGVLCMGSFGPMLSDLTGPSTNRSDSLELITIPTLHLHGTKDVNYTNGKKQLAKFYDQKTSRLLEINYHHAMPWFRDDLMKLVQGIENIYKETQDVS